jgi:uncharacterized protein
MKPKILFVSPITMSYQMESNGGCDGDCSTIVEHGCDGDCSVPVQGSLDSDCACSSSANSFNGNAASALSLEGEVLLENAQYWRVATLISGYELLISSRSRASLVVINAPAREILNFFSEPRDPGNWPYNSSIDYLDVQRAVVQFYEAGLLRKVATRSEETIFTSDVLPLESWLYLTRACNLACAHCFVSKDVRRMSLETGLTAVEKLFALAQQNGHPQVKIKYAGGEPTMNWDLIPALHQRAKSLAEKTGLRFSEVLITNATLLNRERLRFIKDNKIRLSISMDGFGDGHDRQRPVLNGNQTFKRVLQSVCLALEMGLSPYLIMSITRLNLHEVPALVAFALRHRLLLNLSFYRPHVANDPLVADTTELIQVLQKALKVIELKMPDYNFMAALIDRSNFSAAHEHVCGAGRNYLSIDTDGTVLPCHMLTGYNQPGIPLQTVESPRFQGFFNPKIDLRNGCNTCEWRYWCAGGCPIHAKNVLGTSNASSPYCSVYKAIYPELVKLLAHQLILWDINTH